MVNITEVARRGFWAGPAVALGHSLLELVTVGLLALGLSPMLSSGTITLTLTLPVESIPIANAMLPSPTASNWR